MNSESHTWLRYREPVLNCISRPSFQRLSATGRAAILERIGPFRESAAHMPASAATLSEQACRDGGAVIDDAWRAPSGQRTYSSARRVPPPVGMSEVDQLLAYEHIRQLANRYALAVN